MMPRTWGSRAPLLLEGFGHGRGSAVITTPRETRAQDQATPRIHRVTTQRKMPIYTLQVGDNDSQLFMVALPFHRRSCGVCLNSGKGNYQALSLADEIKHVSDRHPYTQIIYKCTNCLKGYKRV
jgi:hypothetical protein